MVIHPHINPDALSGTINSWVALFSALGTAYATVVTVCSAIANFLPAVERFAHRPRMQRLYQGFVNVVAAGALNLRRRLPSLDRPFLGFHHHCTTCQKREDAQTPAGGSDHV